MEAAKIRKKLSVSVVIPVHNEESHIRECLDSLAAQTVQPQEIILVDNNSTDDTIRLARKYKRLRVLNVRPQGIVHARNEGFDAAKSDIIARIDGDIIVPPNWVEHIQAFFAEPENLQKCWTGTGYFYNVRLPHLVSRAYSLLAFDLNKLLIGHYTLWGSNMAITREQWYVVRGRVCSRTDIHEDLDLTMHLAEVDYEIMYDRSLKTHAELRRVHSDRQKLWDYLQWWPRTLQTHGLKRWIWCWLLTVIPLYFGVYVLVVWDKLVSLFGQKLSK